MTTLLTKEDLAFLKWLDSPEQAVYWITNDEGEKVMLREGWNEAEKEYKRIIALKNGGLPPLKFRRKLDGCQLFPGNE